MSHLLAVLQLNRLTSAHNGAAHPNLSFFQFIDAPDTHTDTYVIHSKPGIKAAGVLKPR